ncbi:MAG: hypothetical protein QG641_521, partial [Candidatus Poribacteria bacterium]|nr:hypothetical protein [Candidatus Poribacteria bacterium]
YISASIQNNVYEDQQIYSIPISIFGDAKKVKYLYIRPERLGQSIDVKLTDKDGKILLEKESRLMVIPSESTLVVIVNQNEDTLKNLPVNNIDPSRKIYVTNVSAEYLPDRWKGYDSVDTVILGNFSVDSLSDSQKNALIDWVCSGGTLIISGGVDSQNFVGTFIEPLLPVKIIGTKILRAIPSLSQRFGYDFPNTTMIVALSSLKTDSKAIITEDDGLPIIAEKKIGTGRIIFLCFDYADPALKSWGGNSELWNTMIPEPQKQANAKYDSVFRLLSAQRQLSIPSYKFIGGFLLLYILCLGIVSYIIFERKKGLTWIIMVLITTAFTLCAIGFSYATGEWLPIINDLSIIDVYQDTPRAKIRGYVNIFSSAKTDLKLDFTITDSIFFENLGIEGTETYWGNNFKLVQGDVPKIEIFYSSVTRRNVNGMKALSSHLLYDESFVYFNENVSVKEQGDENFMVTSLMTYDLLDCYLFMNERYTKIGRLRADDQIEIRLNQTFSGNVFDSYLVEDDKKSKFINAIKPVITGNALIGWIDDSAQRVLAGMNVDGGYKSSGMALVIIHF